MAKQRLMSAMDTKRMLAMLYDDFKIRESSTKAEGDATSIYGTYIDDNDVPVSLAILDRNIAGALSAALTLVPKETMQEAIASGAFPPIMIGNLREVFNILSRLFMEGTSPHLRFAEIRLSAAELTTDEQTVMGGIADRLDMEMALPSYGGRGFCSLVTL